MAFSVKNTPKLLIEGLKNIYGSRLNNGACAFCGEPLTAGEYCYCPKALKINPYYKRIRQKVENLSVALQDEEQAKIILKRYYALAKVPTKYKGLTFDDYKIFEPADTKVKAAVCDYCQNIIANYLTGKNLLLTGNSGTGKTMLMAILAENIVRDYLLKVYYINSVNLINEIQDTYNAQTKKTTLSVLNNYKDADFLLIDDIDKINATTDSKKLIYSIINDRYDRVLPTVISANSTIDELDEAYFGEIIVSRFLEKSLNVQFTQKNRRF